MEKAENDNVIGTLYTLRAGLSLVAQEKEAYESEVNAAKTRKEFKIKELQIRKSNALSDLKQSEQRLIDLKKRYEDCSDKARKNALHDRHIDLFAIWSLIILWVACCVATVVCFLFMAKSWIFMAAAGLLCNVDLVNCQTKCNT